MKLIDVIISKYKDPDIDGYIDFDYYFKNNKEIYVTKIIDKDQRYKDIEDIYDLYDEWNREIYDIYLFSGERTWIYDEIINYLRIKKLKRITYKGSQAN